MVKATFCGHDHASDVRISVCVCSPQCFDGIVNVNSCVIGVFLVFLEAIFLKDGIFLCYGRATLAACFSGRGVVIGCKG